MKRSERRPPTKGTGSATNIENQSTGSASSSGATPYGSAALGGELADLQQTPEGVRNEVLNRTAFRLGRLVGGGELDASTVEELLLDTALEIGLHPTESRSTIRSGMRAGERQPKTAPESSRRWKPRPRPRPPDYRLREQLRGLIDDPAWALEWEAAKALAQLPPRLANQDIASSWDYLSDRVNIPRLVATVDMVRDVALSRHGLDGLVDDPTNIQRAVFCLLAEVEGDGRRG